MANAGYWFHRDENPAATTAAGLERALSADWQSGELTERAQHFRGYVLEHAAQQALLVGSITEQTSGEVSVLIDPTIYSSALAERRRAAATLYRTLRLIQAEDLGGREYRTGFEPAGETGFAWAAAAAVVAVSIVGAAAMAYCAYQAVQVVDRQLSRREDMRQLVQRDAQVLRLVQGHTEREDEAGEQLPLDAATKRALDALIDQQNTIIERREEPLSSGLPSSSSVGFGFGLGTAVVIGGLALLLLTSQR